MSKWADTFQSECNVAIAFRAVLVEQSNTCTLDLVPALAAMNESTNYECEIKSQCDCHELVLEIPKSLFVRRPVGKGPTSHGSL